MTDTQTQPQPQPEKYRLTRDWLGEHQENWLAIFHAIRPKRYLEVGSYEGRSMIFAAAQMQSGEVVCVDTWEGSAEHQHADYPDAQYPPTIEENFDFNIALASRSHPGVTLQKFKSTSTRALSLYLYTKGFLTLEPFDFIYIDGDHTARQCLTDMVLAFQILRPGGVMCVDDYLWDLDGNPLNSPKMAVDAFTTMFAKQIRFLDAPGGQVYFIKKE